MTSAPTAAAGQGPRFRALLPHPQDGADIVAAYAYPEGLARPWLRANMVSSADGGAWGPSGRTADLSSPPDRAVMSVLRGHADVVLAGAGTARIEGYRPVRPRELWGDLRDGRPETPPLAVVTRTLDVHPDVLAGAPPHSRTVVITTESAPADRRREAERTADVVVAGSTWVRPQAVLDALAERGLYRVLTEGGPHLLAEFAAEGLLDELCLTLSPRLLGPEPARIVAGDAPSHTRDLRMAGLLESEESLFIRYTRP
ncbi:pyrimidine reductase family protein [Streptomonospora salina]|uniref:Riboflavin biosynthesis pyrimidine reductase n=1 Tax=Streptomonospora salina TaxID=104205 RepID=A0A841EKB4_9ACTN|nr:pyrimidine reductase family protein [Streptomonospora salina]MBB6001218.1 riboflavin biosynthesis pyrimidine reductase [Streptomonospora salina]